MNIKIENIINAKNAKEFIADNFRNTLDILKELREELINLMLRCLKTKNEREDKVRNFL